MSGGSELTIQLDASGVTGGVDEALATLQKIRKLIADTEPITAKLAKGDLRGLDKTMETLRALVNEAHTTGGKIRQALASGAQGAAADIQAKLVPALEKVLAGINNVSQAGGKLDGPLRGRLAMLQTEFEGLRNTVGTLGAAHQAAAASAVTAAEATVAATAKVVQATGAATEAAAAEATTRAKRIEMALAESEAFSALVAERKLEAKASLQLVQLLVAEGKVKEADLARGAAQLDMDAYKSAAKKALVEANRAETLAVKAGVVATENQTVITELQRQAEERLAATRIAATRALEMQTVLNAELKQATQAAAQAAKEQAAAVAQAAAAQTAAAAQAAEAKAADAAAALKQAIAYQEVTGHRIKAIETLLAEGKATEAWAASFVAGEQSLARHATLEADLIAVRKTAQTLQASIVKGTGDEIVLAKELTQVLAQEANVTKALAASKAQLNAVQLLSARAAGAAVPTMGPVSSLTSLPGVGIMDSAAVVGGAGGGLTASAEAARAAVGRLGQSLTGAGGLNDAFRSHTAVSKDLHSAYRGLASGFGAMWLTWGNVLPLLAGAAVSNAVNSVVRQGMEVDKVLTDMAALADYSAGEMKVLTQAVLDFSGASTYGPKEVADGLKVLALAGLDAQKSLKVLPTALDFTKISGEPLEKATEQLVAISTAFGFEAHQMSIVADVIGKTAASTMVNVSDMAASFRTASSVAQQFKVNINDAATSLGLLGQIGIRGQAAGTALRQFYSGLVNGGKHAQEAMHKLGITLYDVSTKQLKAPIDIMKQIVEKTKDMGEMAKNQFINLLSNERGGKVMAAWLAALDEQARKTGTGVASMLDKLKDDLDNAEGYATLKAAKMSQSTSEQFKVVGATLQKDFFEAFQTAKPAIDDFVKALLALVNDKEFKDGLAKITTDLVRLAKGLVDHAGLIAKVAGAYAGYKAAMAGGAAIMALNAKGAQAVDAVVGALGLSAANTNKTMTGLTGAATGLASATPAAAKGLAAAGGAAAGAASASGGLTKVLSGIGNAFLGLVPALVAAGVAYLAWKALTHDGRSGLEKVADDAAGVIAQIEKENARLAEVLAKRKQGLSQSEAEDAVDREAAHQKTLRDLQGNAIQTQKELEGAQARLAEILARPASPGRDAAAMKQSSVIERLTLRHDMAMSLLQVTAIAIQKHLLDQDELLAQHKQKTAQDMLDAADSIRNGGKGNPNDPLSLGGSGHSESKRWAEKLVSLQEELALLRRLGPEADKYTEAQRRLDQINRELKTGENALGETLDAKALQEDRATKAILQRYVATEKLRDAEKAENERTKAIQDALKGDKEYGQQLADEYERLLATTGAVEKMTKAKKELAVVNAALMSGMDAGGKAYTQKQLDQLFLRYVEMTNNVDNESRNAALEKEIKAGEDFVATTRRKNEELQAEIENYGKSKITIAQTTAERLRGVMATKEEALATAVKNGASEVAIRQAQKELDIARNSYDEQAKLATLLPKLESKSRIDNLEKIKATAEEQIKLDQAEMELMSLTADERAKVLEMRKLELHYANLLREVDRRYMTGQFGIPGTPGALEDYLKEKGALDADKAAQTAAAISKVVKDDFVKTADAINNSLTDALMRSFEDGKGFAKNFRDTFKNMIDSMVLRPIVSLVMQPFGNLFTSVIKGVMGSAAGGNGVLGWLSNAGAAAGGAQAVTGGGVWSTVSGWFGGGASAATSPGAFAELEAAAIAGNIPAGASAGLGAGAGAAAVVAVPLIVGLLDNYFDNAYERRMGAATSGDNLPGVAAGSTNFNLRTGALPDREAVLAAINARIDSWAGSPLLGDRGYQHLTADDIAGINDRTLVSFLTGDGMNPFTWGDGNTSVAERLAQYNRNMKLPDYYRGAGYLDAQTEGWWNDWDKDPKYLDPVMVEASRQMALSFKKPLVAVMRAAGQDVSNVQTGFGFAYEDGHKNKWLGHYKAWNGDKVLQDFGSVAEDKYATHWKSKDDMLKAVYGAALDTYKQLDLPEWVKKNVDGAKAQMEKLTGDDIAGQAAALYESTSRTIADTLTAIKQLIDVFPEFAGATQDSVYAIAEAMGGLQNMQQAWSSYTSNFYTDAEKQEAMRRTLTSQFEQIGLALPTDREGFRALMEAALAYSSTHPDAVAAANPGDPTVTLPMPDDRDHGGIGLNGEVVSDPKIPGVQDLAAVAGALGNLDPAALAKYFPMLEAAMAGSGQTIAELIASLLGLQGVVSSLYPAVDTAAQELEAAKQRQTDAQSATDKIWSALQSLMNDALNAAKQTADAAKSIYQMAGDAKRQLWGQMAASTDWSAKQAGSFIDDALRTALQPGGALPEADQLQKAIAAATAGLNVNDFASVADFEVQKAILAAKLGALEEVAGVQLDAATQQVKLLEDNITYWKKQLDLLRGTDLSITSIDEGVAKLVAAMEEERAAREALNKPVEPAAPVGGGSGGGFGGGSGGGTAPWYDPETGRLYDGRGIFYIKNGANDYSAFYESGLYAGPGTASSIRALAESLGVPGFAVGTDFVPDDMLANIHRGEMIVPAAPAGIIRGLLEGGGGDDDSAILEEVRDLLRQILGAADRGNAMFENVTAGGNAMLVEPVKAGA